MTSHVKSTGSNSPMFLKPPHHLTPKRHGLPSSTPVESPGHKHGPGHRETIQQHHWSHRGITIGQNHLRFLLVAFWRQNDHEFSRFNCMNIYIYIMIHMHYAIHCNFPCGKTSSLELISLKHSSPRELISLTAVAQVAQLLRVHLQVRSGQVAI